MMIMMHGHGGGGFGSAAQFDSVHGAGMTVLPEESAEVLQSAMISCEGQKHEPMMTIADDAAGEAGGGEGGGLSPALETLLLRSCRRAVRGELEVQVQLLREDLLHESQQSQNALSQNL